MGLARKADGAGEINVKNILIIGGSSYVGRALTKSLSGRSLATYNTCELEGGLQFDSVVMRIGDIIRGYGQINQAVLLLGDTNPDSCFANPLKSQEINVNSIKRLVDDLLELGIRPIFTSSEFVFDGSLGNYLETDKAEPILLYGSQKLEVEHYLQSLSDEVVILRLAKVFGIKRGDGTLLSNMLESISRPGEIYCAEDQRFSPVFVDDVVSAIEAAIELPLRGIYHVAGPFGHSRLDLLRMILEEANPSHAADISIIPCSIDDFDLPERRPKDVSMRSNKLIEEAGWKPLCAQDACRLVCEELS